MDNKEKHISLTDYIKMHWAFNYREQYRIWCEYNHMKMLSEEELGREFPRFVKDINVSCK